jgi:hypothetical protein
MDIDSKQIKKNKTSPSVVQGNVIYGGNTPLFNKLISILNNGPINSDTQKNIESFLFNQGDLGEITKISNKNHVSSKFVAFFIKKILLDTDYLLDLKDGIIMRIISNNLLYYLETYMLDVKIYLG